jgi:hypothetical protein
MYYAVDWDIYFRLTYDLTRSPSDFGSGLSLLWRSVNFDCIEESIYCKYPLKGTAYPEHWSALIETPKYVGDCYKRFNNPIHLAVRQALTNVSEENMLPFSRFKWPTTVKCCSEWCTEYYSIYIDETFSGNFESDNRSIKLSSCYAYAHRLGPVYTAHTWFYMYGQQ